MQLIAYHFSSGDAFFTGVLLLIIGGLLGLWSGRQGRLRIARVLGIIGVLFVALSATPSPVWFYALGLTFVVGWFASHSKRFSLGTTCRRTAFGLLIAWCLIASGWESVYRFPRHAPAGAFPELHVIGDSLSSGMQESPDEPTWPRLLRQRYRLPVVDHSHVGATASSARKQAQQIGRSDCIVLIEIGGNDLLGSTTRSRFAAELESLLKQLDRPGRCLVMLELPLPPFYNEYGRIQRRLARRFDVLLIPKREFASVIFAPGNTMDGLHFSEQGHAQMAEMIHSYVAPCFRGAGQGD